jgi:phosphatidylserine synthase
VSHNEPTAAVTHAATERSPSKHTNAGAGTGGHKPPENHAAPTAGAFEATALDGRGAQPTDDWQPVTERPPSIASMLRPADFATLLNAGMGLGAFAAAWHGNVALALHLILAAIIVDGLDGAIARLGGGGGPLGAMLDTLADAITFVAAPAFIFVMGLGMSPLSLAAAFVFLAAGMLRLARFQEAPETDYFLGLSTPGGAILLAGAMLLGSSTLHWLVGVAAASSLMLSTLPLPKLRGKIGLVGLACIVVALGLYATGPPWARLGITLVLLATGVYIMLGPTHVRNQLRS